MFAGESVMRRLDRLAQAATGLEAAAAESGARGGRGMIADRRLADPARQRADGGHACVKSSMRPMRQYVPADRQTAGSDAG